MSNAPTANESLALEFMGWKWVSICCEAALAVLRMDRDSNLCEKDAK